MPVRCGMQRASSKGQDGFMLGNMLALYTHLHFGSQPKIVIALVNAARRTDRRVRRG